MSESPGQDQPDGDEYDQDAEPSLNAPGPQRPSGYVTEAEDDRIDDPNRDPGASPESQGLPDVADDASGNDSPVPEPSQIPVPTDEPVASTAHGVTVSEQLEGARLDDRLAAERDDTIAAEVKPGDLAPEQAAMHEIPDDELAAHEQTTPEDTEHELADHELPDASRADPAPADPALDRDEG